LKVILGLGNPGREYERTRHNVGWWVVDHLADVWRFDGWKKDGQSLVASGRLGAAHVRLVKPLTYMNLSGAVLVQYARRPLWAAANDLLVVLDDVALPIGRARLRARGSSGGHNGLKSIERQLGNQDYARLRIGIRPEDPERSIGDLSDFVLAPFGKAEREEVLGLMPRFVEAVETWVAEGILTAMNQLNR
jgi:PTH1 family peptidyl-tRNA hydrolase